MDESLSEAASVKTIARTEAGSVDEGIPESTADGATAPQYTLYPSTQPPGGGMRLEPARAPSGVLPGIEVFTQGVRRMPSGMKPGPNVGKGGVTPRDHSGLTTLHPLPEPKEVILPERLPYLIGPEVANQIMPHCQSLEVFRPSDLSFLMRMVRPDLDNTSRVTPSIGRIQIHIAHIRKTR